MFRSIKKKCGTKLLELAGKPGKLLYPVFFNTESLTSRLLQPLAWKKYAFSWTNDKLMNFRWRQLEKYNFLTMTHSKKLPNIFGWSIDFGSRAFDKWFGVEVEPQVMLLINFLRSRCAIVVKERVRLLKDWIMAKKGEAALHLWGNNLITYASPMGKLLRRDNGLLDRN